MEIIFSSISFCLKCSEPLIYGWKGLPLKDRIPILPILESEDCPTCGGSERLISTQIEWLNVHGVGNILEIYNY